MRRGRQVCLAAASAAAVFGLGAARAEPDTLGDAISLAYQTNPTLQAQRAAQRAVDEEYAQAEAGLRPTVTANANVTVQRNQLGLFGPTDIDTSFGGVSLSQPIYTGGRVATAVDAAQADILAGREALRSAEITVLQNVIQAYLDVRRGQAQLAIAQDNVTVLGRQLAETQARFDVGDVTRTDVAQAQARQAQGESELAQVQSQLAIARAAYDAVVGENPGDLAPEPPLAQLLPATVDAAFDAAERDNPQLRQALYAEQANAAHLAQAKAQTRPQVSVSGSLGYTGGETSLLQSQPIDPLSAYTRDVTVSANVSMPLFAGGLYASQIRQAAERDNVTRIGVEAARRQVLQAVSQAWNQLLGARSSLTADDAQVQANKVAYQGVREEQKVGLRTTLDVLNAQQELESSELALVSARHDEYLAAAAVLAAMGALEARNLAPDTPRYDPKANFDKVRHAPGWVPWDAPLDALDHLGAPRVEPLPPPTPPGEVVKP